MTDEQICRSLINQVSQAADGDSEINVVTVITPEMWKAWQRWTGVENSPIYGSRVIVIHSEPNAMFSMSRHR